MKCNNVHYDTGWTIPSFCQIRSVTYMSQCTRQIKFVRLLRTVSDDPSFLCEMKLVLLHSCRNHLVQNSLDLSLNFLVVSHPVIA